MCILRFINSFFKIYFFQGKTGDVLVESDKQWSLKSWCWKEGFAAAEKLKVTFASSEEGEEELPIPDKEGGEQQVVLGR